MNKNIALFTLVALCNIVRASDVSITVTPAEIHNVAASQENQKPAFVAQRFSMTYKIAPANSQSTVDFEEQAKNMQGLILGGHRSPDSSSDSMYNKILIFIKELQEAILAGLNIFGTVTTTEETIIDFAGNIATDLVTEKMQAENATTAADTTVTKSACVLPTPQCTLGFFIEAHSAEELVLCQEIKEKMMNFANAVNNKTDSPEAIAQMMVDIVTASEKLQISMLSFQC